MKYSIVVIFLTISSFGYGQNKSKDYNKLFNTATKKLDNGDYYGANKIYLQLYKQDSLDKVLNFNMGVCYYETKRYKHAQKHFIKTSSAVSLELFRYKANIAHINKKFKKAINYYNAYKIISGKKDLSNEETNRLIEKVKFAEIALKDRRNVTIHNMGEPINTKYSEYVPLISADESMLFFSSRRPGSTGGLLDPNGRPFEDVYVSLKKDNLWTEPKQLPESINTATNDACVGLSPDGQALFIFRTNPDLFSGDLYESRMGLDEWETPQKLGSNINSEYTETSASITLDDKVLYFSSDRPGGFGGKDIYKVVRLPNGAWSKAINLGPVINTAYDEDAPFIYTDNKTLYFSSTGHQNMGGYDIFKSELKKGVWSNPENLKYPINTVRDDIFFVLAANGKVGYYSSSRDGGFGEQDIYKVVLKDEMVKLHVLKAIIVTNDKGVIPPAKITLIENESKKVKGIYKPNDATGKFILLIDPEKTYNIVIEAKNYHSLTAELDYNIKSDKPLKFKLDKKTDK
jgi:tetratricopeptide (TPR) repeat protein